MFFVWCLFSRSHRYTIFNRFVFVWMQTICLSSASSFVDFENVSFVHHTCIFWLLERECFMYMHVLNTRPLKMSVIIIIKDNSLYLFTLSQPASAMLLLFWQSWFGSKPFDFGECRHELVILLEWNRPTIHCTYSTSRQLYALHERRAIEFLNTFKLIPNLNDVNVPWPHNESRCWSNLFHRIHWARH